MLPLPRFLLFEHRASETIHEIYRVDRKFPSSRTQRARFLTRRKMNSSKRQACSSPDVDLKPILIMNDSGGRAESPLIRTDNDADDDPIPILPSPGFNVTENQTAQGREAISKQKSYPASGVNVSVKETDSCTRAPLAASMGTKRTIVVTVTFSSHFYCVELGSRLNSPLISGMNADTSGLCTLVFFP